MSAVLGPKSLYSGLAICSLPPLELNEANIIQDTSTTYPAMNSQSAMLDPRGRWTYKLDRFEKALSEVLLTMLPFHLGQDSTAIVAPKKKRLPQKRGRDVQKNASPARYVNHEVTSSPTRIAVAHLCATDSNW